MENGETDGDRVFLGDGAAPAERIAELLCRIGYNGCLSPELFIKDFGGKDSP